MFDRNLHYSVGNRRHPQRSVDEINEWQATPSVQKESFETSS
jgi:hypothetical protein